jgi:hypothetical protein
MSLLRISKPEWAWAGVNVLASSWGSLFFLVKEPVAATLLLAVSLIAGELGGRAASRWVATKERKG